MVEIPVIDFSVFSNGNVTAKQTVVEQIYQACHEIGFMYLKNSGISIDQVAQVLIQSKYFFDLPLQVKQQQAWSNVFSNQGYVGIERERLDRNKPGDLKEAFNIGKQGATASATDGVTDVTDSATDGVTDVTDSATDGVTDVTDSATDGVTDVTDSATDGVTDVTDSATDGVTDVTDSATDGVTDVTDSATDGVTDVTDSATDEIADVTDSATDGVTDVTDSATDEIADVTDSATDEIADVTDSATDEIADVTDSATDGVTDVTDSATDEIADVTDSATDGVTDVTDSATDGVTDVTDSATDGVTDVTDELSVGLTDQISATSVTTSVAPFATSVTTSVAPFVTTSAASVSPAEDPCILAFYEACTEVANRVLQAFALALQLPCDFFATRHDRQNHTLRLLHYPPLQQPPKLGQVRAGEHSDYGSITLLFQDEVGGLEVQTASGEWIAAPPIPDTVVVNTGDLMQRWTNHVFCSTKHRVMIPGDDRVKQSRYSVAFFCHPNDDTEIACLESCQSERSLTASRFPSTPIYPPIAAGDYLISRLQATY